MYDRATVVVLAAVVFCLGLAIGLWQADDPRSDDFPAAVQVSKPDCISAAQAPCRGGADWYTPPDQDWAQVVA